MGMKNVAKVVNESGQFLINLLRISTYCIPCSQYASPFPNMYPSLPGQLTARPKFCYTQIVLRQKVSAELVDEKTGRLCL